MSDISTQTPPVETDATPAPAAEQAGGRWQAILAIEGVRTGDRRYFTPGAFTWRELPLTLACQFATDIGHDGAVTVGRIDTIERVGNQIRAAGVYDTGPDGQEAQRLVGDQMLRGVSIDPSDWASEILEISVATGGCGCDYDCECAAPSDFLEVFTLLEIGASTIVNVPAIPGTMIVPDGTPLPDAVDVPPEAALPIPASMPSILAAAVPVQPPASWFANPNLEGPTPLTVAADGRVYGHAAVWGTCHTGFPGQCLTPPQSGSNYAYFRTGAVDVLTADSSPGSVPVGQITLATGHADLALSHRAAAAHYDDTGTAVADVAAGEDSFGIWVAGAVRPGVTDDQMRVLRASSLSGDWRTIGGRLELVALLAVNVPGFPVQRLAASAAPAALAASSGVRAGVRHGEQLSLVAAGMVNPDRHGEAIRDLRHELAALRRAVEPLFPLAVERIGAALG